MKKYLTTINLFIYITLLGLFGISLTGGDNFFLWIVSERIEYLNPQIVWLTTYGFILAFFFLFLSTLTWNKKEKKYYTAFILCLFSTFFITYFFKFIFLSPRPYQLFEIIPLVKERTLSFPSAHSSIAFCVLPMLMYLRPKIAFLWALIAIAIAFSRIYLGVHLPQEVLAGAILGFAIGDMWRILVTKFHFLDIWDKYLELRRQTVHALLGLLVAFALKLGILPVWSLLAISIVGVLISLLSLKSKIPIITYFLRRYERKYLLKVFPGRGVIFYFFSCFLTMTLFDPQIALASILVLALMDSTAHVVGKYLGHIKNPLNRKKHIEGFFAGLLAGTLGAMYFVPFQVAILGCLVGSFIEIFEIKIFNQKIDDNLTIPLVSAFVMSLFY